MRKDCRPRDTGLTNRSRTTRPREVAPRTAGLNSASFRRRRSPLRRRNKRAGGGARVVAPTTREKSGDLRAYMLHHGAATIVVLCNPRTEPPMKPNPGAMKRRAGARRGVMQSSLEGDLT